MPGGSGGDPRKLIIVIVAAALTVSWITIGTFIGYAHIPARLIGAMCAFDLAVLYLIWRVMGPRNPP